MKLKRLGNALLWIGIGGFTTTVIMGYDREFVWLSILWVGIAMRWIKII